MMKMRSVMSCGAVELFVTCASAPNETTVIGARPAAISSNAMAMADALSDGVIRQFPGRF